MSTQHLHGAPLVLCKECRRGNHDNCLRIPHPDSGTKCECPRCWNEAQDRLNAYLASQGKEQVIGANPEPAVPKSLPKSAFYRKMKTHRRLRPRSPKIGGAPSYGLNEPIH